MRAGTNSFLSFVAQLYKHFAIPWRSGQAEQAAVCHTASSRADKDTAVRWFPLPFLQVSVETQLLLLFAAPPSGQAADGGHPHAGRQPGVTRLRPVPL